MDQPQHQVFGTEQQSYRYMAYPFQRQNLQLLYPGRFMESSYHYTGDNIPNEDPVGLAKTQAQTAALAKASKMEQEALARHLGGRDKVVAHPAVEPEATIEDPDLSGLTIGTSFGLEGNLDKVPSKLGDLRQVERKVRGIAADVRKGLVNANPAPLSEEEILPRYDWKEAGVGYDGIQREVIETYAPDQQKANSGESETKNQSSSVFIWIPIIVIGILAILFIILIIYGAKKHRAYAKASRPKTFNIVSPEFIPLR